MTNFSVTEVYKVIKADEDVRRSISEELSNRLDVDLPHDSYQSLSQVLEEQSFREDDLYKLRRSRITDELEGDVPEYLDNLLAMKDRFPLKGEFKKGEEKKIAKWALVSHYLDKVFGESINTAVEQSNIDPNKLRLAMTAVAHQLADAELKTVKKPWEYVKTYIFNGEKHDLILFKLAYRVTVALDEEEKHMPRIVKTPESPRLP